jgi:hypothetical protein
MRRDAAQETERDFWAAIDRDSQARELRDLAAIHNPHREAPVLRPAPSSRPVNHIGKASMHARRQASIKPTEALARQRPRFKDLGLSSGKHDRKLGKDTSQIAVSFPKARPARKWSARDQRAIDRMKRERAQDRTRDR